MVDGQLFVAICLACLLVANASPSQHTVSSTNATHNLEAKSKQAQSTVQTALPASLWPKPQQLSVAGEQCQLILQELQAVCDPGPCNQVLEDAFGR